MRKNTKSQWLAGVMAAVLAASLLGGCGGGSTDSSTAAETTTAAAAETTQAAETAAPETQDTTAAAEESQAEETESDLAAQVRGNTDPSPELIEQVNSTLDDSYLGDYFDEIMSDYSVYDGRFDGVTLDVWMPNLYGTAQIYEDLSEHPVFQKISEFTGIQFNFITPTVGEEKTEFNLMISGGELPDLIYNVGSYYAGGLTAAMEDGLIIDLAPYEDKLPNYLGYINTHDQRDALHKDTVDDQGRRRAVYELYPKLDGVPYGPSFYKKAMEDTGWTEVPETIDEYHSYLTDCKNAGYDVPLISGTNTGFFNYDFIASAYGVYEGLFVNEEGKIAYGPIQDGLEDYLSTMNQWYQEGLIDKDFATMDSAYKNSIHSQGEFGLTMSAAADIAKLLGMDVNDCLVGGYYPVLNKGDQPALYYRPSFYETGSSFSVTTQCDDIDAALAFLDFCFTKKGTELISFGSYGDIHLVDENGMPYYPEDSLVYTDEEVVQGGTNYVISKYRLHNFTCVNYEGACHPRANTSSTSFKRGWTYDCNPFYAKVPNATILTSEESASVTDIISNLTTLRNEYYTKIIIGALPLSAAEEYRQKVKEAGVDDYIAVYQAAYERYLAR